MKSGLRTPLVTAVVLLVMFVTGTAYVVLGGRQPGLFTSDVTETLRLP